MDYSGFTSNNIAPKGAKYIGLFNSNNRKVGQIELASTVLENTETKQPNYSFGILSDVHHDNTYDKYYYQDKTSTSTSNPESAHDLNNALHFFEQDEKTKFTCISGDLTVQDGGTSSKFIFNTFDDETDSTCHLADLDSFKYNVELISPTTPVFICKGNHDCGSINNATDIELANRNSTDADSLWTYYTDPTKYSGFNIVRQSEDNTNNFYFEYNGDVFIFASLDNNTFWDWSNKDLAYSDETVVWLEQVLSDNAGKRCFVFTHLMFDHNNGYAGNFNNNYGSMTNWYNSDAYEMLEELTQKYSNVVWFNGHTHWKWRNQEKDTIANVTNVGASWQVHIPSGAYPRDIGDNGWIVENNRSEGGIVEVYDDYILVKGIVFKDGDEGYINKVLPIATYKIPVVKG